MFYRISLAVIIFFTLAHRLYAQNERGTTIDSLNQNDLNWFNLDPTDNKIEGASVDKAYLELLAKKNSKKKIVVAVIDGGVDIYHEDLQGKIWTNHNEIAGNGIDDDHNGYIDDLNGWNFIGNISGKNIVEENLEHTRIVAQYKPMFDSISSEADVAAEDIENYRLYMNCKLQWDAETENATRTIGYIENFMENIDSLLTVIEPLTKTHTPSLEQLKSLKPETKDQASIKKYLTKLYSRGYSSKTYNSYLEHLNNTLNYHLNINLKARTLINDNLNDLGDAFYGNNDVKGEKAFHGTFVSGIIAAKRDNNLGINGIASNVEIMALRCVPDGDEEDKDVALSIMYAVDNGANIINMSFGKDYSPRKAMVDQAIKYAEQKGVLLIHAAGNDANNSDDVNNYPLFLLIDSTKVNNWITVGANSKKRGKTLPATFSNYGQTTVDLFAPGADIISLCPENRYDMADGTSFSCPVVSGVAALVWSYYPELSVGDLKEVLLQSVNVYTKKVIVPNLTLPKDTKAKFTTLSVSGGIVNAFKALQLAEEKMKP